MDGGFVKYGYRHNTSTGMLEIDEAEAKVVLAIFNTIDEGWRIAQVRDWLNTKGIPTKRKGRMGWTCQLISKLLRDRAYTGKGLYGKYTRAGNGFVKGENPVPMPYPQIVPDDIFNRVHLRLCENKKKNRGPAKTVYILMHLGRCGQCGGRLYCREAKGHYYLYCMRQHFHRHLYHCFQPKHWNLNRIEDYIWNEVEDVLDNYEDNTRGLLLDRFENAKEDRRKQIARAKEEIDRCKLEKQRLLITIRKGWVTEAEAGLQFKAIRSEMEHWEQEVVNLETLEANADTVWDSFWSQLQEINRMFNYGFTPTVEQKKQILNLLLDEFILYNDGKIQLRFKLPVNEKQVAEAIANLSNNTLV